MPAISTGAVFAGVLVLAAALRFGTLSARGFWGDEMSTVFFLHEKFGSMLHSVARLESTPPLYYSLAWVWAKAFGTTEAGMRSLPALLGVATVPVIYLAARELVSRRAALVAATLVAVNPLLVWYSQEARSYSLLVFLSAAGLFWFARALREPRRRDLAAWAMVSSLALATHYFAVFIVLTEAVLLARAWGRRPAVLLSFAMVGVTGALLLPLLLQQRSFNHATWISHSSILARAASLPAQFAVGFDAPRIFLLGGAGALLIALGVTLGVRQASGRDLRGGRLAAALCVGTIGVPLCLGLAGLDYFNARNALTAVLPATIAVAAGFSVRGLRLGAVAGGLMVILSLTVVVTTADQPKFRSEDWRAAAADLVPSAWPRAVVAAPGQAGAKPLRYYLGASRLPPNRSARVREIDVVVLPRQGHARVPRRSLARLLALKLPGFSRTALHLERDFALLKFRSPRPVLVSSATLARQVGWGAPRVLLQPRPVRMRGIASQSAGGLG